MDIELRVPRAEARDRLTRQITEGERILRAGLPTAERLSVLLRERGVWSDATRQLLYALFTNGDIANQHVALAEATWMRPPSLDQEITFLMGSIRHEIGQLQRVLQALPQYSDGAVAGPRHAAADPSSPDTEVLVVHDEDTEEALVAPYLRSLGLTVSALKLEERGTEIMARLENAAVGFAVVLLTAEPTGEPSTQADTPAEPSRQTVFGLGYALGKLGEGRVCALTVGNVVEPSNMPGLRCTPLDSDDGWKFLLAKELRTAGFAITVRAAARGDAPRK